MSTMGSRTANGPTSGAEAQGASSTTEQAKEKVQETAQQAAGQARGRLRQQVDQRSTQAGEQVTSTADDVRTVAQQLREQGKEQPAKVAEQAAERAERLGSYLKQADGDTILRDIEDFGRRQPWAVMFGGLAAGFLASRFLKASSSRRYESAYQRTGRPYGDGGYAGRGVMPPATSVPPAVPTTGAPLTREPGLGEPTPGRPAEDVSLSGGVMPGRPGATR
jgi:hypothetical protein